MPPPIIGKVGQVLLSSESGCCILIGFLFLGYFCQSIYLFDVAICHQQFENKFYWTSSVGPTIQLEEFLN